MTGRITGCGGSVFDLPPLLSWNLDYTGGVPCDSFSVTFPYENGMAETLRQATGFEAVHQGKIVLRAIVDEYSIDLGPGGVTASLSGRGMAARLLDNESQSVTYQDVTLAELIRKHVSPYGITVRETADLRAGSVYTVPAGASQWRALEGFCRTYGAFLPRFTPEGDLLAAPEQDSGGRLLLGEGDLMLSCSLREDRYGVVTEALVIDKTRQTSYSVRNEEMIALGGQCRRVIYTPGQSTWDAMRYTGEYQIKRSKEDQTTVTVRLPGSFLAFPGDIVSVDLPKMGLRKDLRVAVAENDFSPEKGAAVTLTLKERG